MRWRHWVGGAILAGLILGSLSGCQIGGLFRARLSEVPPQDLIDRDDPAESVNPLKYSDLKKTADDIRELRKLTAEPKRKYNTLVLSGGGMYGAYSAGVLCGWTCKGDRPEFDVITGISTGALIAVAAFLGPDNDPLLRQLYTTIDTEDIYTIRRSVRGLFAVSVADTTPFEQYIARVVTPEYLARVAAEHQRGRRLYVGSTNLTTRRLVVWDMGAIAARGTPEALVLFRQAMIASASIPGFFPPVTFDVDIDGRVYQELHVDGGVTRSMFYRPPYVPPDQLNDFGPNSLAGSNLYALVAGKVYADSEPVKLRTIGVAGSAIGSLLYAQNRGDLLRLFTLTMLTGMNYYQAAIPPEFKLTAPASKFDRPEMNRLFAEGFRLAAAGQAWRTEPPDLDKNEEMRARTGLRQSVVSPDRQPTAPPDPAGAGREGIPPVIMLPKR